MFVRTATRRNKDGTAVRYLQLVHNEWDPAAKSAKMRVLHNFGREDQVDKAAIERLAGSLCRLLDPGRAAALREPGLVYQGSVAFGGPWLLDQLWQRLGIGAILTDRLARTRRDASAERVLFALVANRALDPSSKLAAAHWVGRPRGTMPVLVKDCGVFPGQPVPPWPAAAPDQAFVPPVGRGFPRYVSDSHTGRCPACGRAWPRRLDGKLTSHMAGQDPLPRLGSASGPRRNSGVVAPGAWRPDTARIATWSLDLDGRRRHPRSLED